MAEGSYEVGYGKPPRHSQFQKGQSGFKGRRHTVKKTVADYMEATLAERIPVVEGGKTIRLTRLEVFIRQFVARAINGDRQALKLLLDYLNRQQGDLVAPDTSVTDQFLLAELTRMMGNQTEEVSDAAE